MKIWWTVNNMNQPLSKLIDFGMLLLSLFSLFLLPSLLHSHSQFLICVWFLAHVEFVYKKSYPILSLFFCPPSLFVYLSLFLTFPFSIYYMFLIPTHVDFVFNKFYLLTVHLSLKIGLPYGLLLYFLRFSFCSVLSILICASIYLFGFPFNMPLFGMK